MTEVLCGCGWRGRSVMVAVCPLVAIHCGHHSCIKRQLQWVSNQRLECLPYQVEVAAAAAVDSPVDHNCCTAAVEGPVHASASSLQLEACTPSWLPKWRAATNLVVSVLLRGRSRLTIVLVRRLRAGRLLIAVTLLWTMFMSARGESSAVSSMTYGAAP